MLKLTIRNEKDKELSRVLDEVRTQMKTTILSYPERDPRGFKWGQSSYNGNCSGKIPLGFIDKLGATSVCELFAGSGTLSDVAKDYGIKYAGVDLNPNPVRNNIYSMDITNINEELPNEFYCSDLLFSHPPYPGLNHVKYCDHAWKDTVGGLKNRDIQNMDFESGMKMVNLATIRGYATLPAGSYMVILVGEIRSNGRYYSMLQNMSFPGEIYQTYVKLQHNTWSGRQGSYTNTSRALTAHEMIVVLKKPSGYELVYVYPKKMKMDIRDSKSATWKDVVAAVMNNLKSADLSRIYSEIEGHEKIKNNPMHWKEKIRQTLQYGPYISDGNGLWSLAS